MFFTPCASVSTEPAIAEPSASQQRLSFITTSMPPLVYLPSGMPPQPRQSVISTVCCQLGLQQGLDSSGVHVFAVANDLGIGIGRGHSGADDTGLTVMQTTLAVVGMRKAAGASIDSGGTLIIGGIGVANAGHDALCAQSRGISGSAIALGRHGALDDTTAGGLLPLVKNFLGRSIR